MLAEAPVLPAPVLVVEDEPLLRLRLGDLLQQTGYETEAVLFAASLAEARALLEVQPIALALVDLGLPDGNGLTLIEEMRNADPSLPILVVSAWSSREAVLSALKAGATGYVLKERDEIEMLLSIRSVLRGGAPIDPFIAQRILELLPDGASEGTTAVANQNALSGREDQILRMISTGMSNLEIAAKLSLSRYTIECHIKHIYRKLAVSSRTRAINEARNRGLLV
ncbi:MAG: response regulator transcription factor [Rudaea sp.]|uniref:response regulator transcription factor n=1 Tax=unclassified Rudaea TaxID=2627037 RepID=UPI0010F6FA12|nr:MULTISPECIES: response regulator transcription factor [unclassified Rudaea]MBN8886225.1 response regulator transcription factor [Rudaea sp.]